MLDGVDKQFVDICGPTSLAVPPFFMWPVRLYSAAFNTLFPEPLYVRASGVLYALAALYLLWLLVGRLFEGEAKRVARALSFSLLGLGMLPLLLVWSRPEQPILLCLLGSLLLSSRGWGSADNAGPRSRILRVAGIVGLATIAFSYHPRAVILTPVFLLCAFTCLRGARTLAPRLIGCALVAALAIASASHWSSRMSCPTDPAAEQGLAKRFALAQIASGKVPPGLLDHLADNANILRYPVITAPSATPMASWITPGLVSNEFATTLRIGLALLWTLLLVLTIAGLLSGALLARTRTEKLPPLMIAAAILVLQFGWAAMQEVKNTYEATAAVPLLILCLMLSLHASDVDRRFPRGLAAIATALAIVCAASVAFVSYTYLPSLVASLERTGFLAKYTGAQSLANYPAARRQMIAAAAQCGIVPDGRNSGLLVDDVTYFAFMHSYRPQQQIGLMYIKDPRAYLASIGSAGAILTHHRVPPQLADEAICTGQFCCLRAF